MFKETELRDFNLKTRNRLREKYDYTQMGFFNGSHLAFVGVNPGMPFSEETRALTKRVVMEDDYEKSEQLYHHMIKQSLIGLFISKTIGDDWKHISFTNLVKIPTEGNSEPSQALIDEFSTILEQQLGFLAPNLVIAFGGVACAHLGLTFGQLKKVKDQWILGWQHPSYFARSGKTDEGAKNLNSAIEEFCKKHCVVRVTDQRIYFRDAQFAKKMYPNHCRGGFYFVPARQGEKSDGHSYKGNPLKKRVSLEWNEWKKYEETYEGHLRSKDLFYYETFGDMSHSKCLKYLVFDIENWMSTDIISTPERILSIGMYDSHSKNYVLLYVESDARVVESASYKVWPFLSEIAMLDFFWKTVADCDLIVGWYSNGFDTPYLINRSRKLGIQIERYLKGVELEIDDRKEVTVLRSDSVVFMDALEFYKRFTYYDKPPSFSLNAVAYHLFKEQKIELPGGIIECYEKDIQLFMDYNMRDVELTKRIIDTANVVGYALRLQQICPQDFENVYFNSKTIENLLHHRYWKQQVYFPTKVWHSKTEFQGAVVIPPSAGTHTNVVVYDFAAMYTSIYITFNFSPDTILPADDGNPKNVFIESDLGKYVFKSPTEKVGILPKLEREMLTLRNQFKDERDKYDASSVQYKVSDELQGTFKTILNSIYGVAAYEKFILYDPRVAASITAIARKLIGFVSELAEEHGHKVLYGDTDSIFISIESESEEELAEKGKQFTSIINQSFPKFVLRHTKDPDMALNHMLKVEFEKAYNKFLITTVKKRYFGTLCYRKGKILNPPQMSVVGFETRRDDTPPFFKKALMEAYTLLLDGDRVKLKEFVRRVKRDIETASYDDLVEKKKLSMHPDEYVNSTPQHVRALKNSGVELKRGESVEMLYVKTYEEIEYPAHSDWVESISNDQRIQEVVVKVKMTDKDVVHRVEGQTYNIDVDLYIKKFLENKIRMISEDIANELFNEQRSLNAWLSTT